MPQPDPIQERQLLLTRREFFGRARVGIGAAALGSLLAPRAFAARPDNAGGLLKALHFAPKAKRIIYLFQSGGPSQIDLFDYKPELRDHHGKDLPDSVRMGQRLTGMTSGQNAFPMVASKFQFSQHGEAGAWMSELIPHMGSIADDLCVVRTVHTEAINHDPGITYIQTGSQQPGRPSLGAWMSYGLGSECSDLPAFIVLISQGSAARDAQALFQRLWGAGFLPSEHQGVNFRSNGDPVLYLSNPEGLGDARRRRMLDALAQMNELHYQSFSDPETKARIAQYEMAYKMQASVPSLMDIGEEPDETFALYGESARKPGTYAANCLLARRLAERGVRFIQLYHRGWDQHFNLPSDLALQCGDVDQASAALVKDLKQQGLLDETLVIWGGEFGRTTYCQGALTEDNYGRDHHGRCFTMWMAGGGVNAGYTHGETDPFCYNIVRDGVHVHDLNATILRLMGIDHKHLTYRFQGRDFRLTDVHGELVKPLIA